MTDETAPTGRRKHAHRRRRSPRRRSIYVVVLLVVVAVAVGVYLATTHHTPPAAQQPTTTTTTFPPLTTTPTTTPITTAPTASTSTTIAPTTTTTTPIPSVAPGEVLVQVWNGSGAPNQAALTGSALSALGFHINGTGDEASFSYTTNIVRYAPGDIAYGEAVAKAIIGATSLEPDPNIPVGYEVELIIGSDYKGVVSPS